MADPIAGHGCCLDAARHLSFRRNSSLPTNPAEGFADASFKTAEADSSDLFAIYGRRHRRQLGAFAQAFSAPLAETLLGHDDRLAAAVVFVGFIALFAWGGFLLRGSALRALQYSLVLMLAAMTLAIGAFVCQNFLGFVLSWAGCGLFSGIGAAAAMKISMADIHADERAEMLALIYAVGYAASAIFGFMASVLANYVPLWQLLCAVFIWILSLILISLTSKHLRQYAAMVEFGALHRKAGAAD